ncbi:MAG: LIC12162 family protein [Gemmatimonadota bacterium]|nr:LIC12162 family protein [Gemmatimonadota bacterium]
MTTALEESWPEHLPVLFLGEWCRRYDRKVRWTGMDAEVLPYHWDDRAKLFRDFEYLQQLNERLLRDLATELNRIHGENHSLRYWRIVLGFWLNLFTGIVLDGWETVRMAAESGSVVRSLVLDIPQALLVPNDTDDFARRIPDDLWHHGLYARLIKGWTDIPVELVYVNPRVSAILDTARPPRVGVPVKRRILEQALRVLARRTRPDEYFLISTYLSFVDDLRLQWNLGQVPKVWRSPQVPMAKFEIRKREWHLNPSDADSTFEQVIRTLLPEQLPTIFIEGYRELAELVRNLPWPHRPRVIWTSNQHFSNDLFKSWAADKAESGSPIVTGQHGAEATGLFNGAYAYQEAIGNMHLTWSRDAVSTQKERPVGVLKNLPQPTRPHPRGHLLLVTTAMPRYSFDLRSTVIAGQMLAYFDEQFKFVSLLPDSIQRELVVRIAPSDYGWSQKQRWQDRFPSIRLDGGASTIRNLMAKARLAVSTYNATTYLESFSMNVPTVMYWNPVYWELRESAIPYFAELKHAGIFHDSPEAAARQVTSIWDDIEGWWSSALVREVRRCFSDRYCYRPPKLLPRIAGALLDAKNLSGAVESS